MNKFKLVFPLIGLTAIIVPSFSLVSCNKNEDEPVEQDNPLCFTGAKDGGTSSISYTIKGTLDVDIEYYKEDGQGWRDWDGSSISLSYGEKMYVRNTKNTLADADTSGNGFKFNIKDQNPIKASGNVNSMINFADLTPYCFYDLFNGCSDLITPPELPATELAEFCYKDMFGGCTSLTFAPVLPANTLTKCCYKQMFWGCSTLKIREKTPADINDEGLIFVCPKQANQSTYNMFHDTGGEFKQDEKSLTTGNSYYWYTE